MKTNLFDFVQVESPKSSLFDLSNSHKTSFDMGELVPIMVREALPGDKFQLGIDHHIKLAPMLAPVMERLHVTMSYFFVPNRLLWSEWEDWIFYQTQVAHPYVTLSSVNAGTLADYMGIPLDLASSHNLNVFPFAAYYRIYDDWYRDQRLISEKFGSAITSGAQAGWVAKANGALLKRAWMHDYFTSCLPYPQEGNNEVYLPLGDTADVDLKSGTTNSVLLKHASDQSVHNNQTGLYTGSGGDMRVGTNTSADATQIDPNGTLEADLSSATSSTIRTLRRAFKLQEWFELLARVGTRQVEGLLGFFGVKNLDARLDRPELIGSTGDVITISEVLSSAHTYVEDTSTPVGNMAGHGVSVGGGQRFNYTCPEHGWIIGLLNVQPMTSYKQGIHRHFFKANPVDDYAWPQFAHIGEQAVLNRELYANAADDDGEFGYIPRYAEYKYANDLTTADMANNLEHWNLTRKFASEPALNESFVECTPDTRIFAVTGEVDHVYAHVINHCKVIRKLPKFGNPKI
jgi:hypothetical protein